MSRKRAGSRGGLEAQGRRIVGGGGLSPVIRNRLEQEQLRETGGVGNGADRLLDSRKKSSNILAQEKGEGGETKNPVTQEKKIVSLWNGNLNWENTNGA